MIDYATAKRVCETYTRSLEASDLESLLDLFADDASIEDPVGTPLREGKEVLRAFYAEACQGVAKAELTGSLSHFQHIGIIYMNLRPKNY